jgi:hypothetical protein
VSPSSPYVCANQARPARIAVPFTRPRGTATRNALDGVRAARREEEELRDAGGREDDGLPDAGADERREEDGVRGGGVLPPGAALGRTDGRIDERIMLDDGDDRS